MNKNKIKKLIATGLIIGGVVVTGTATLQVLVNKSNPDHTIENMEGLKDRFDIQQSVVSGLQEEIKLNVLQVQAKSTTTIHHNKTKLGIFKNNDMVTFVGSANYFVDFRDINAEQVEVDGKAITLTVKEPELGEVSINENLTQIQRQEGVLSWVFEETNLTQEEHLMLMKSVKDDIRQEALKEIEIAKEKATTQIENLINKLTKEDYQVRVNFVK